MCKSYSIIDLQGYVVAWCCADSQAEAYSWIPVGYRLGILLPGFDRSKYYRATKFTYRSAPYRQTASDQPIAKVRRGITTCLSQNGAKWLDIQPSASAAVAILIEAAAKQC